MSFLTIFALSTQYLMSSEPEPTTSVYFVVNAEETSRYYNHQVFDDDHGGSNWAWRGEMKIQYDLEMSDGLTYRLTIYRETGGMRWKGYGIPERDGDMMDYYANFYIEPNDELHVVRATSVDQPEINHLRVGELLRTFKGWFNEKS